MKKSIKLLNVGITGLLVGCGALANHSPNLNPPISHQCPLYVDCTQQNHFPFAHQCAQSVSSDPDPSLYFQIDVSSPPITGHYVLNTVTLHEDNPSRIQCLYGPSDGIHNTQIIFQGKPGYTYTPWHNVSNNDQFWTRSGSTLTCKAQLACVIIIGHG